MYFIGLSKVKKYVQIGFLHGCCTGWFISYLLFAEHDVPWATTISRRTQMFSPVEVETPTKVDMNGSWSNYTIVAYDSSPGVR